MPSPGSKEPASPKPPRFSRRLIPGEPAVAEDDRILHSNYSRVDMSGGQPKSVEWVGCTFAQSSFESSEFDRCSFDDCRFEDVDFASSYHIQGGMRRVALTGCRLAGMSAPASFVEDASFQCSKLTGASFRFARMRRVLFEDSILAECDFASTAFSNVTFLKCDLSRAQFSNCVMDNVSFDQCKFDGVNGLNGLAGATVSWDDLMSLAPPLATSVGIVVRDA